MEQRWIPVAERLPEDGIYIITFDGEFDGQKKVFTGMCGIENGRWWDEDGYVTAWMPLPEPYRKGEPPKQTNADRIRSMTDEELAAFCCKVKADYQWADHEFPDEDACEDWEEWLRAESEG